ncbi:MAG TPA: low-specificity L-threonine aldolase [Ktedonobacteraceae bacterium]|nr:low-specificity L-threonine aldolase [Ktedonobacteraceae bacterium]
MLIDLRSDTVTHPTQEMREAMYRAEVGDDVYDEDPTINHLQELAAEITGKEAALFVPSGTMGNLLANLTHAGRREAIIVGSESHIYNYEAGGPSTLGGSPMYVVPNEADGTLNRPKLEASFIDDSDPHSAPTALLCIENTHNRCGGKVLSVEQVNELARLAHSHNTRIHMDGARVFNAAVALQVPVKELVAEVDSVMFCLSKGLCAPVGSMLVGSKGFIRGAYRNRKLVGGGMRQAGIIAAAGIVALQKMVDRLAEDHENSKRLAQGLADFPQIEIDSAGVATNIVIFSLLKNDRQPLSHAETLNFVQKLQEQGVRISDFGGNLIRAVTHNGIGAEEIDKALAAIRRTLIEMHI